jgi:MFS family permease
MSETLSQVCVAASRISMDRLRRERRIMILLSVAYGFSTLDRSILPIMITVLQRDLHITDTEFAVLQGLAFGVFYSLAAIPLGWLSDRYPRRTVVALSVGFWSAMTAMTGLVHTYRLMLLTRIGLAVGESSLQPAAYSMLADLYPKEKLGRAIGLFSVAGPVGASSAFLIGGMLMALLASRPAIPLPLLGSIHAWQVIFLIIGLPGIVLAFLIFACGEPARRQADNGGKASRPALWESVKRDKLVYGMILIAFTLMLIMNTAVMAWFPAMMFRVHHAGTKLTGVVMAVGTAFGAIAYVMGGYLADRWIKRGHNDAHMRVGVLAALLTAPTVAIAAFGPNVWVSSGGICLSFFAASLSLTSTLAGVQLITPPYHRATLTSVLMALGSLIAHSGGTLLVALITEKILKRQDQVNIALVIVACVAMPIAALCFNFARARYARLLLRRDDEMRISTEAGEVFRFEAGQRSSGRIAAGSNCMRRDCTERRTPT